MPRARAATVLDGRGRRDRLRAVIYTRKSTSEGLKRDFNSLDNQRERAEAYAASQDWSLVDTRYDDGGFSGKNTDRPALQRLLADAERRSFDVIVVYKLDRLSRSLFDFVGLHRLLEKLGVEIVSVTEPIDTRTPMGRAFVNILVSFGQMEREQTAERTRDKIRAARHRGKWTGGTPRLGYDCAPEGGRLIVNREEADQIRAIFDLYIEKQSLLAVAQELNRRGWRRKSWTTREGKVRTCGAWNASRRPPAPHRPAVRRRADSSGNETFPGEHDAIVTKKVFDQVQRILDANRR